MSDSKSMLPKYAEDRMDELIEKLALIANENHRPANEVILDDEDVMKILKICKRSLATLRDDGLLKFSKPKSKIYYKLSDVLELINSNEVKMDLPTLRLFGGRSQLNKS